MPDVISNSSCIILLQKIDRLPVLEQLYGAISITSTVQHEIGLDLPSFVRLSNPQSMPTLRSLEQLLDPGEASTIALGFERPGHLLILDDFKARRIAGNLGLSFTGTLGVIVKARRAGLISSARSVIHDLTEAGIWISDDVLRAVLLQANE